MTLPQRRAFVSQMADPAWVEAQLRRLGMTPNPDPTAAAERAYAIAIMPPASPTTLAARAAYVKKYLGMVK